MPYAIRTRNCCECGAEITGRLPPARDVRCLECGVAKGVRMMRELYNKDGAGYDQWRLSMIALGERLKGDTRR